MTEKSTNAFTGLSFKKTEEKKTDNEIPFQEDSQFTMLEKGWFGFENLAFSQKKLMVPVKNFDSDEEEFDQQQGNTMEDALKRA